MSKTETMAWIGRYRIIAILRGLNREEALNTAAALYAGGIRLVEITFDQSGKISQAYTAECIAAIAAAFPGRLMVGAGTVMDVQQVDIAAKAGASYIISPDTNAAVIQRTFECGLVSIPGALTPTEIACAHTCGADYVKLFPAGELGLSYIRAVQAPLNHIQMLAVGGVDEKNLKDFLAAGLGVGIGSNIVNKTWVKSARWDLLTAQAQRYTAQLAVQGE